MNKSVRDGIGFTGVGVVVSRFAESVGVDPVAASALGLMAATFAAAGYRWLRTRWPWLAELDPSGSQQQNLMRGDD